MIKLLPVLLACLLALSTAQTCSSSTVARIQSGILNLGVSATPSTAFTQNEYVQTLAGNLGIAARIHNAFAIAGFQGSCTQAFFALKVESVSFQNVNTKMRFKMNYDYTDTASNKKIPTQWTKVKLTYILIADSFESYAAAEGGNYIYADSIEVTLSASGAYGLYTNTSIYAINSNAALNDIPGTCGYLQNLPIPRFDTTCTGGSGDIFIPHYYIMGFEFAPGSFKLGATAELNNYLTSTLGAVFGRGGAQGYGPIVKIDQFGGSLKKIKVAFVLTLLKGGAPSNAQSFSYSGIYTTVDLQNIDRPITRGGATGQYNKERWDLAKPTYQIYGLTSFKLNTNLKCLSIDIDVEVKNLYTLIVRTDNTDDLNSVIVSGDFFSKSTGQLCGGNSGLSRSMTQVQNINYSTVPDLLIDFHDIKTIEQSPLKWKLSANPNTNLSNTVTYTVNIVYENFIPGNTYKFDVIMQESALLTWATAFSNNAVLANPTIRFAIEGDGNVLNDVTLSNAIGSSTPLTSPYTFSFGFIAKNAKPTFKFTVVAPRPIESVPVGVAKRLEIDLSIAASEYTTVYIPSTDCCSTKCPDGSGVNFGTTPPSCIVCVGDKNLNYDTKTGFCTCKSGFYNILEGAATGGLVCFPCLANLCSKCSSAAVTNCTTCIIGATLNTTTNLCSCSAGFYEISGTCKACPAKCNGCSVGNVCNACADTVNRRLENNCACNAGFFDDGTSTCKTCNSICKTCSSINTCTECFTENNRTLINGQCVCASGFFQIVNADNSLSCRKCSSDCKQCQSQNVCLDCKAENNRILGYDEMGRKSCICASGYTPLKDNQGSCVQNGCTADVNCQDCDQARGLQVCIQCVAASNRVLSIPQYSCICRQGFYQSAGSCLPCTSGCAKCSSATVCERCAVSATDNKNGSCSCPQSYFFATEPIRYCKRCNDYCLNCTGSNNCITCLPGFSATNNGQCICPRGNFVNSNLQCVQCINNCSVCSGENTCTLCADRFFLQDGKCVTRCNVGFYISGSVCQKCQDGCSHCEIAGSCLICQAGRYSFNGLCYINCPSGSIASTTQMTCIACNSPCGNCVQHPSKCLTCLTGNFFQFSCPATCPTGTFSDNGICKYCSFQCAACLGNENTCIACPEGQFLFEGKCSSTCPIPLVSGRCPNICPSGFFTQSGTNNCVKCNDRCKTCQGSADRCTSCVSGIANNGACVQTCPANTLNVNGNCVPCSEGCNGCTQTIDKCVACQSGFISTGTRCFSSCAADSFRDANNTCKRCDVSCKTCSAANFCTLCTEEKSTPVNGVCSNCITFCATCSTFDVCTSCQQGFVLFDSKCTNSCPRGSSAVNGVCRCTSGLVQQGTCVSSCSSGFANINGKCEKCSTDCAECTGTINTCSGCKEGFVLNAVTGRCSVNTNCQIGQYFSIEQRVCKRICPTGFSYENSMCVSQCAAGFKDNSFGGCVSLGAVSGCSFPLFYQQGTCVSTCDAGTYPNSGTRVCQACGSDCFSCLSSAFCTSCSSGFDLKNSICITGQRCAGNRLKYNGVCLDSCPVGTIASNGFCERRCDPETYFFENRCYTTCPTGLGFRTDVACVASCPSGYTVDGKVCKLASQICPSGQFFNLQSGQCSACAFPCAQCQYTQISCTVCAVGTTLNNGRCVQANSCGSGRYRSVSGSCMTCPSKCAECFSQTLCDSCATGFEYNGDCVPRAANLKQIGLTVSSISRRSNTVFVSVKVAIVPNGLSSEQKNNFFLVVASQNDKIAKTNQWISESDPNTVIVAIEYSVYPTRISSIFLVQNAALLRNSLAAVGYKSTQNSYLSVAISTSIAAAPATLQIPQGATNSQAQDIAILTFGSLRTAAKQDLKIKI